MSDRIVDEWLVRLCDPAGYAELPAQRLTPRKVETLLELATAHGVDGAVVANLRRLFDGEGPERLAQCSDRASDSAAVMAAVAAARQRWLATVAMSLCLRQRAAEVQAALRRERIPVALIKGEDFADRLYGEPSLRPFRDIDLMVPRTSIDLAAPTMSRLGFRNIVPSGKYNEDYGERTWDSSGQPRVRVELHWNLINCPSQRRHSSVAFEELQWDETAAATGPVLRATPAAQLLVATVHAAVSHRFDRLQHLCDVRQICRGAAGRIDFDWLRAAALSHGNTAALTGALDVTRRLLQDPACAAALRDLRLPVARTTWQVLVNRRSLLHSQSRLTKLRRTVMREWLKRAA